MILVVITGTNWDTPRKLKHTVDPPITHVAFFLTALGKYLPMWFLSSCDIRSWVITQTINVRNLSMGRPKRHVLALVFLWSLKVLSRGWND